MRKVFFILITLFVVISGCEKIMHPEESSFGNISNYDELCSSVDGVYGQLAIYIKHYDEISLKGDDLNDYTTDTGCVRNTYVLEDNISWGGLYKTIISANNILIQFSNISSLDKPTGEIIAEVYFLRAYCYFRLTRLFGQIPLIDNIDIDYNIASSSYSEVYQFIEKDLQTAINYLPKTNAEARIPFVTSHRGAAKAVLAEVYLHWAGYPTKDAGKYISSANMAKEVIDSSMIFGFKLMDDYAFVWDSNHFYNEESVFSLFYSNTANYNKYSFEGCYFGTVGIYSPEVKHFLEYQFNPNIRLYFPQVEINFYNNYPKNYRRDVTFFNNKFILLYYKNVDEYVGFYYYYNSIDLCDSISYRKFYYSPRLVNYDEIDANYNTYYYVGNPKIYIYRYAQTLLTYAEAKARSGQLDASAYEAVNMIRRRANRVNLYSASVFDLQAGLSTDAFADSVVWERAWELCGEPEGRWFDLVRLEKVEELPNIRNPREGGPPLYPITKDDYFFNKPSSDIILNPNL
jgi:starch-binding outer membrane protein, SusD/RagB family